MVDSLDYKMLLGLKPQAMYVDEYQNSITPWPNVSHQHTKVWLILITKNTKINGRTEIPTEKGTDGHYKNVFYIKKNQSNNE